MTVGPSGPSMATSRNHAGRAQSGGAEGQYRRPARRRPGADRFRFLQRAQHRQGGLCGRSADRRQPRPVPGSGSRYFRQHPERGQGTRARSEERAALQEHVDAGPGAVDVWALGAKSVRQLAERQRFKHEARDSPRPTSPRCNSGNAFGETMPRWAPGPAPLLDIPAGAISQGRRTYKHRHRFADTLAMGALRAAVAAGRG